MKPRSIWSFLTFLSPIVLFGAMFLLLAPTINADQADQANHTASLAECGIKKLTGFHCPGCGGTRCAQSIFIGDWSGAMAFNPMLTIGFVVVMAASIFLLIRVTLLGKPAPSMLKIHPRYLWLVMGGVMLFGVLRNIPSYPFSLLAP